ncbi:transcriptional regulator [Desulfosporosinus orientis DSM 765]|uniref:Transcriptional regulator n=1 Tax=Desulfosporosinus orientis (strain ATCC 19365 / DSM 765 / NCIMB 8382 / VKM B-1628 / Singapore I) TaxID=768706 RepID=G7WB10_DESOD|nr:MarR family transcriptional regulator [Desulfosporosinus orientis]AET67511.1 transcriptional regulator [Desulfosporosinus orientis DSM 765]
MENSNKGAQVAGLFHEVMGLFRNSMMKAMGHSGITPPQGMVLRLLSKEGPLKLTDLSTKMSLSNSTVSGIVDRLEKQGLVERTRSDQDRRVVYIAISPEFKERHKRSYHLEFEKKIEHILNQGSAEELERIFVGLNTLKRLLKEYEQSNQE